MPGHHDIPLFTDAVTPRGLAYRYETSAAPSARTIVTLDKCYERLLDCMRILVPFALPKFAFTLSADRSVIVYANDDLGAMQMGSLITLARLANSKPPKMRNPHCIVFESITDLEAAIGAARTSVRSQR